MTITAAQKAGIEEIINILCTTTAPRGKRQLSGMFMELVDRANWPQYFELIPEPRCLNNIRSSLEKNRYKDASDAFTDLSLVFWNAMFYNEPDSQISQDAETLKGILQTEWKKRTLLPIPRESPPPSAPQKVHAINEPTPVEPSPAAALPAPVRTDTPVIQPPLPGSGGTTQSFSTKHTLLRHSRPSPPPMSQTIDVDVGGMPLDHDGQGEDVLGMEREVGSEEIVKQLEKGMPKWGGFGEAGWMDDVGHDRHTDIIHIIKSYKDVIGNRVAAALESVPEESTIPNLSYSFSLSLKIIEGRVKSNFYSSSKEFDLEMARLFEKARRWHEPGTETYGCVLLLQRFYQSLTSSTPPPGPPYTSTTNFASLRAGPGNIKPLDAEGIAGITSFRVSTKERLFVDEVHYKGWSVKLADWLHLSNPDDPSRPIIGQVFKCWTSEKSEENKRKPSLTVCWYHRPEQTFHSSRRQFWEGEVFKTDHFADHPLEDIVEKIACQFTAWHIRGRPRPPYWYPGWPLYVCDSRYNDRDRVFVKIKNWNSCVPEEVRKNGEFMPIYPFERSVFPRRLFSPFLRGSGKGVKGPGGIDESAETAVESSDKVDGDGAGAKKKLKRAGTGTSVGGDHAVAKYAGTPVGNTTGVAASGFHYPYQPSQLSQQLQPHQKMQASRGDRSTADTTGGLVALENHASIEKLPLEAAKHFDRDPETNEVLWFAAPPMNVARATKPKHSLAYLHFLAMKRKESEEDDGMDVDGASTTSLPSHKRRREHVPPTVTEAIGSIIEDLTREE